MPTNTPTVLCYALRVALLASPAMFGCEDDPTSASRAESLETDRMRDSGAPQVDATGGDAEGIPPAVIIGPEQEADAGLDAGMVMEEFDAGVDGCGGCPQETPLCDRAARQCHACEQDSECLAAELGAHCLEGACVECVDPAGCTDPSASSCDLSAHVCVGCFEDADCEDIRIGERPLGVCSEERQCVECSGTQMQACGTADDGVTEFVCNSLLHACTTKRVHSESVCGPCVSDAECAEGMRCVKELFGGEDLGYVCQWTVDGEDSRLASCSVTDARPYNLPRDDVPTIDGETVSICALTHTTCNAVRQFGSTSCGVGHDESCGKEGFDDALCRAIDARDDDVSYRCTLPCTLSTDCPRGHACNQELPVQYCELQADTCFSLGDCAAGETCEEGRCVRK